MNDFINMETRKLLYIGRGVKLSDLTDTNSMINEIRELLLNARKRVAVQVNTELLSTYWNVGKIIVEHE